MAISPVQIYQNPTQNSLEGLFANMSNALTQSMGAVINTGREMLATQKAQEGEFLEERKFQKDYNQRRAEMFRGMWEFDVGVQEKRKAEDRAFGLDNQQMALNRLNAFNDYRTRQRQLGIMEQGVPDPEMQQYQNETDRIQAQSQNLNAVANYKSAYDASMGLPKAMDPEKAWEESYDPDVAADKVFKTFSSGDSTKAFINSGDFNFNSEREAVINALGKSGDDKDIEMGLDTYINKPGASADDKMAREFFAYSVAKKPLRPATRQWAIDKGIVQLPTGPSNALFPAPATQAPPPATSIFDAKESDILDGLVP